jgi:hypothetical protein
METLSPPRFDRSDLCSCCLFRQIRMVEMDLSRMCWGCTAMRVTDWARITAFFWVCGTLRDIRTQGESSFSRRSLCCCGSTVPRARDILSLSQNVSLFRELSLKRLTFWDGGSLSQLQILRNLSSNYN